MKEKSLLDKYFTLIVQENLRSSSCSFRFYCEYLFKNISFNNKTVLDSGGGSGLFSFYAGCMGAKEVVCLEPQKIGSHSNMIEKFKDLQSGLRNLDRVKLELNTKL